MAFVRPKDRVLEKSTTSGNGPYTLAGSGIDASYNAFNSAMSVGDTTLAFVVEPGVAFWSGIVTYSAANQITLTTVYESKGTFGAGTKEIFMGLPASRAVYQDQINTGSIGIGAKATSAPLQVSDAANPDVYSSFIGAAAAGNKGKLAFTHRRASDSTEEMLGYIQAVAVDNQSQGGLRIVARTGSGDTEALKALATGVSIPITTASTSSTTGALTVAGGVGVDGKLSTAASTSGRAGLNVPTGVAPSAPASGDIWNDGVNMRARIASTTKMLADQGMLRGFLAGLRLTSFAASSAISIAAGAAADSSGAGLMVLAAALTKTTAAWAVGSGNGGLDTGTIAINTWYDLNLIERLDTGVVDAVFTLAGNAPTLPSGYTLSRRLTSMKTDASGNWLRFYNVGREFIWDVPAVDANVGSGTPAGLQALTVPPGVSVLAHMNLNYRSTSVGSTVLVHSPLTNNQALGTGNVTSATQVANLDNYSQISVVTDTSRQVRLVSNGAGTVTWALATTGWTELD